MPWRNGSVTRIEVVSVIASRLVAEHFGDGYKGARLTLSPWESIGIGWSLQHPLGRKLLFPVVVSFKRSATTGTFIGPSPLNC